MRILIIDFEFPEPDRNSGGHRLFEIVEILANKHEVAFLSWDYWWKWNSQDPKYERSLNELGVKTLFVKNASINSETGSFIDEFMPDIAVLSKYYIANIFYPYLSMVMPMCRTILDTVDIHFIRESRREKVVGGAILSTETEIQERSAARMVDRVWTVTKDDAGHIWEPGMEVAVVPNIHAERAYTGRDGRRGIVFVGNYVHQPNCDAVWYLANRIIPELYRIGVDDPVIVAGAGMEMLEKYSGIEYAGWKEDLDGFLSSSLVGIAPLRYGAGMKGKIGDYLANGLPVVTTSIGAEGMELVTGYDSLIADDPADFADCIANVIRNPTEWERISKNGKEKVAQWSPDRITNVVLSSVCF